MLENIGNGRRSSRAWCAPCGERARTARATTTQTQERQRSWLALVVVVRRARRRRRARRPLVQIDPTRRGPQAAGEAVATATTIATSLPWASAAGSAPGAPAARSERGGSPRAEDEGAGRRAPPPRSRAQHECAGAASGTKAGRRPTVHSDPSWCAFPRAIGPATIGSAGSDRRRQRALPSPRAATARR